MSSKCYAEEFKIEAIRLVVERGYSVAEVSDRPGMTAHNKSLPVLSLCRLLEVHPRDCYASCQFPCSQWTIVNNPYTNEPFEWHELPEPIVIVGLQQRERATHRMIN